jgi:hypothetical protein
MHNQQAYLSAVQQREAHLQAHGSRAIFRQITQSIEFVDAANDMMTTFHRTHLADRLHDSPVDDRRRKMTKKEEARINGVEIDHVSITLDNFLETMPILSV